MSPTIHQTALAWPAWIFVAVEASNEEQDEPPCGPREVDTTGAGATTGEGSKDVIPPPPPVEAVAVDIAS